MRPITELTVGHVGKTVHITDSDFEITGTLERLQVDVDVETIRGGLIEEVVFRTAYTFIMTLHISGNVIYATLNSQWELADEDMQV